MRSRVPPGDRRAGRRRRLDRLPVLPGRAAGAPRIPEAAGGWTDCVLRCDRDGLWWYESLSGAPMPDWLSAAVTAPAPPGPWRIDWTAPDRDAHRAGVLACLEAIAAGEVYQACVCTQFTGAVSGSHWISSPTRSRSTAPARAAYLAGSWGAVASLSPELFLRRRGDSRDVQPDQGHAAAACRPGRRCAPRSRTSPRTS